MAYNFNREIKEYGNKFGVPISLDDTLTFLCDTINKNNCKQVLEIGTAIGYGAISIAQNTSAQHIDTLENDPERIKIAQNFIDKLNVKNVTIIEGDAINYLKNCTKKYDFVYLDGPKGQYPNYLPYILNLLNKNGILVADNLNFHGMVTGQIPTTAGCRAMVKGLKKYINLITTNPNLYTKILNIGDGLGVTVKK